MAGAPARGLRFFGVMDAEDASSTELKLEGMSLVTFRDLGAVVSDAPYVRVTPGEEELAEYVRVIDALYKHGPIVPAPPGTVFRDSRVLQRWMEIHYAKLHEALGAIEQRESTEPPYDFVRMDLGA